MLLRPEFTSMALEDVAAIQDWTLAKFGKLTSLRYHNVMEAALADLLAGPTRLGVRLYPAMRLNIFVHHLYLSRKKPVKAAIEKPRQLFVFRFDEDIVTVLRVLHDSMDLTAHVD